MYCGKNKTACATRRQTAEALLVLLQDETYAQISVTQLCHAAGISRQTFYNLFRSKENVLVYILEEDCGYTHPRRRADAAGMVQDLAEDFSSYVTCHADVLKTLVENDMTHIVRDMLYEGLSDQDCIYGRLAQEARDYAASFTAGALTGIAESYVRGGCSTEHDKLAGIIYTLLTGIYAR